jgi:hypothetical protein
VFYENPPCYSIVSIQHCVSDTSGGAKNRSTAMFAFSNNGDKLIPFVVLSGSKASVANPRRNTVAYDIANPGQFKLATAYMAYDVQECSIGQML